MRVVVGLDADQEPEPVAASLRALGADPVQGPAPSLPGVLIADFSQQDATVVETVKALPGVRYAEPEQLRSIE